jgi:hypothetical protein
LEGLYHAGLKTRIAVIAAEAARYAGRGSRDFDTGAFDKAAEDSAQGRPLTTASSISDVAAGLGAFKAARPLVG